MATQHQISLEQYLRKLASSVDNDYGQRIRQRFRDIRGSSELAMLAVAIMTPAEKANAVKLSDKQIQKIAADAGIDTGIFAIFINGYVLESLKHTEDSSL